MKSLNDCKLSAYLLKIQKPTKMKLMPNYIIELDYNFLWPRNGQNAFNKLLQYFLVIETLNLVTTSIIYKNLHINCSWIIIFPDKIFIFFIKEVHNWKNLDISNLNQSSKVFIKYGQLLVSWFILGLVNNLCNNWS